MAGRKKNWNKSTSTDWNGPGLLPMDDSVEVFLAKCLSEGDIVNVSTSNTISYHIIVICNEIQILLSFIFTKHVLQPRLRIGGMETPCY